MSSTTSTNSHHERRRKHQKSRNGCARCKSQHRKCDEVHPQCGPCQRRGVPCSLNASPPPSAIDQERPLAIDDLRFLHHWLKGDGTLFEDHNVQEGKRERDRQMQLAFTHPYLLHTILSIAALEMFHERSGDFSLYAHASSHNLAALQKVKPHVGRTGSEHSEALYLFSAFTSLYALAEPPLRRLLPEHASDVDVLADLLNAFRMGRGIIAVSATNTEQLHETTQSNSTLWPDETEEVMSTLHEDFPHLKTLLPLVGSHYHHIGPRREINEAVVRIFAIISLLQQRPKNHSSARLIQTWPMHAPSCLLAFWEDKDPVALIILAHYAVMVDLRTNLWFFHYWPTLLIKCIEMHLPSEWSMYLEWPRDMLQK